MTDLINPFAGRRVWDRWRAGHEAIDYGLDNRTPFGSPAAGTYRHDGEFEDAGIRGTLHLDDGRRILFCHLAAHVAGNGARVAQGTTLALSGNTGTSSGPHMHTYGLDARGRRWNWTIDAARPAFAAVPAAPEPQPEPEPEPEEDSPMKVITASSSAVKYELRNGRKRAIGQAEWRALRALEGAGLELLVATVAQGDIDAIPGS